MTDVLPPKSGWVQNVFYILTVCGVLLGVYWNIVQTINSEQVQIADIKARLEIAEKTYSEIRTAMGAIQQGVADLRVEEAQRLNKK